MTNELDNALKFLHESADRFKLAQKAANFAACEIHDDFIEWFPSIDSIIGDINSKPIENIKDLFLRFHVEDRKILEKNFQELNAQNSLYTDELRFIDSDGAAKWISIILAYFNDNGKARYIGVALNISARKESEEERNILAQAISQTLEAIVIANLDGEIIYVNKAYEKLIGYSLSELIQDKKLYYFDFIDAVSLNESIFSNLKNLKEWSGIIQRKNRTGEFFKAIIL